MKASSFVRGAAATALAAACAAGSRENHASDGTRDATSSSSSAATGTAGSAGAGGAAPIDTTATGAGSTANGASSNASSGVGGGGGGAPVSPLLAGDLHVCSGKQDGSLWCWGNGGYGDLGDGMTMNRASPVEAMGPASGVVELALGDYHTCARRAGGVLSCWGWNAFGQLGDGKGIDQHSPTPVPSLVDVQAIAAGAVHTCALKQDGSLWCWGANSFGQLGDGTTVYEPAPVQVVSLGTNVVAVAAGGTHSCAQTNDGALWCWGSNQYGELGDGTKVDRHAPVQIMVPAIKLTQFAIGWSHSCALAQDGSLRCWGENGNGQLGDGTTVSTTSPPASPIWSGVVAFALGGAHTCARKQDGSLWCWGFNSRGEIGDGTTVDKHAPVQVAALGNGVVAVAAGGEHTCARSQDGSLWCWGRNISGELGNGAAADTSVPLKVSGSWP